MPQPLHIFRAGRHRSMQGNAIEFGDGDLADCAAVYDPKLHEAPIVVGHPRHDGPAYGWVSKLTADSQGLHAEPNQVDPAFAELVQKGRYKKISASFYHPDATNNPAPGHWYLRHVGFLGALAPAVKGLRQTEFAEGEEGVVEFADLDTPALGLLRRVVEWLSANGTADDLQPSPEDPATQAANDALQTQNAQLADEVAQLRAEAAERAQREADAALQAAAEADARRFAAHTAFAEGLVETGRLAPKQVPLVVAMLNVSEQPDESGLAPCFGEGDDRQNLTEAFCEFLEQRDPVVSFGEFATGTRAATPAPPTNPLLDDAARRASHS